MTAVLTAVKAALAVSILTTAYWVGLKAGSVHKLADDKPPRASVRLTREVNVGGHTFPSGSVLILMDRNHNGIVTLRRYSFSNDFIDTFDFWVPASFVTDFDGDSLRDSD